MSSTNRGYDRHKSDYYVTPKDHVNLFLNAFQKKVLKMNNEEVAELDFLDPCCGGDKDNGASYIDTIKELYNPSKICGIDIREDSHADIIMNYFECEKENMSEHDIIISNPPFYAAEGFIEQSLNFVKPGGYVVMLLRLNFFGSKQRKPLFDNMMPSFCFVHHKRMNFITESMKKEMKLQGLKPPSGDSIEYAHFVWKKETNPDYCKTFVI